MNGWTKRSDLTDRGWGRIEDQREPEEREGQPEHVLAEERQVRRGNRLEAQRALKPLLSSEPEAAEERACDGTDEPATMNRTLSAAA